MGLINITFNNFMEPRILSFLCLCIASCILLIAMWKIFTKAGKPGWGIFIPFYNSYCQFDIVFGNGWLFLLLFVPLVNFVILIMLCFKLAKAFGRGIGFGFGLLLLPCFFIPALGFSDAEYVGPQ